MAENPKISTLTHTFLEKARPELDRLETALANMRKIVGEPDLKVHSAERQIEHFVGGFLSAVEGVKDLEEYYGGKDSRLSFIRESLEFYLEERFNEKTILKAVEDGTILNQDNPIPAMRRMQRILKSDFNF